MICKNIFNRKKKNKRKSPDDALRDLATKPASLNASLLLADAKMVVHNYLLSIYKQDISCLPMKGMDETFYYMVVQQINQEINSGIRRQLDELNIIDLKTIDYDNRVVYAIRSITYDIQYIVVGTVKNQYGIYPFKESRNAQFVFKNDTRVGWLLSQHFDDVLMQN